MTAKEFYNLVVRMRKAQKECEKLNSTYNRVNKSQLEAQVDAEIKRVEQIQRQQADNQQLKML